MSHSSDRLHALDAAAHRWLVSNSMTLLRISLGAVFLGFGTLKLFPAASPAEGLATATTDILLLGLVPGSVAIVIIGALECTIGFLLVSGRWMRPAVYLLGFQLVGILSPLVLLPGRLFAGPAHAPTLEGQYVLKDVILVAAVLVVATTLRGGRIAPGDHSARAVGRALDTHPFSASEKLAVVMAGTADGARLAELCAEHGITESDYEEWRRDAALGARRVLARHDEQIEV